MDDKKIMAEAERLEVKEKAPLILARVLFDDDMCKQIGRYKKVFARVSICSVPNFSCVFDFVEDLSNKVFFFFFLVVHGWRSQGTEVSVGWFRTSSWRSLYRCAYAQSHEASQGILRSGYP